MRCVGRELVCGPGRGYSRKAGDLAPIRAAVYVLDLEEFQ